MTQDTVFFPSGPEKIVVMNSPPGIAGLFVKIICLSLVRPVTLSPGATLENVCFLHPGVKIAKDRVHAFNKVCGYETGTVPAGFIQSLFIGMISRYISSSFFPVSPLGLIQIAQSFELIQPVQPAQSLDLFCRLLDMTRTEKGLSSRFLMEAALAGHRPETMAFAPPEEKNIIWQGIATYLTRSKTKGAPKRRSPREDMPLPIMETIDVPENTGRRYAAVSRDINPHHLYAWSARLIGFKQPIAHGIWSMARAGASLENAAGFPAMTGMEAHLKLPIFMPANITLGYALTQKDAVFELRDKATGVPHLTGRFHYSHTGRLPNIVEDKTK